MNPIEKSPCYSCTRFPYHGMCTDNTCRTWQEWFVKSWDTTCDNLRSLGVGTTPDIVGSGYIRSETKPQEDTL